MDQESRQTFKFPIPFDPFRLLLAVMERWKAILLGAVSAATLGALYAFVMLGDTYTAKVELIKRAGAETTEPDPSKPYAPRPLDDEALMIAAYAKEVFELASASLGGQPSPDEVKGSIGIEPVGAGGLFALKARSKEGREEAYKLAHAYANSLIAHTASLRKREALEQSELLEKQLAIKKTEIEKVNAELLAFAEENSFFSEKEQGASLYAALEQLKQKTEDARVSLGSTSALILNATRELEGPGYLRQLIAKKRAEIDTLRESATDDNPTVKRALAELQDMENRLAELELQGINGSAAERGNPARGANDGALTSTIIRLEEDRKIQQGYLDGYEEQIRQMEGEIDALPEKMLTVTSLKQNLEELQHTAAQLESRLGETRFHASSAPGVVKIFQNIDPSDVDHRSRIFKSVLLGLAGLFLGGFGTIGLAFVGEMRRRTVRSPLQAAIATGSSPALRYDALTGRNGGCVKGFWLRNIARFAPDQRRFLFAVLGDVPAEENFWSDLFSVVGTDDRRVLFMDFGAAPLRPLYQDAPLSPFNPHASVMVSTLATTNHTPASFLQLLESVPEGHLLLVRWDTSDSSWLPRFRDHFDRHFFLTSTRDSLLANVEAQARNYREVLGDANGTILVDRDPPIPATRLLGTIEDWYIESRTHRPAAPPQPAL